MEQRLLSRFKWGLSTTLGSVLGNTDGHLGKKMYADGIELPVR